MTSVLVVRVDTKRILAEDYRNGKKRVCLNKVREIRRTKAGGFAQKKYQRHVDLMKSKTLEWVLRNLSKPGVLRFPYDEIQVECPDKEIEDSIRSFLLSINEQH